MIISFLVVVQVFFVSLSSYNCQKVRNNLGKIKEFILFIFIQYIVVRSGDHSDFRPIVGPPTSVPANFFHGPKFPKQNCTVVDEMLMADICTPGLFIHHIEFVKSTIKRNQTIVFLDFETECFSETVTTKRVVEVDHCVTLNITNCKVTEEPVSSEVCTYEYNKKEEQSSAKTVVVKFEKKCRKQKVTVCDYRQVKA